ncbi:MAG: alpha/beta fold hydrolase [Ilumatobacter sp.]|uniref:esterase/lipase family protein n=1 Tax=Ilumatobacter sp. TaxID=1967498 RepID=UPI003C744C8D
MVSEARGALEPFRLAVASPALARRTQRPTTVVVLPGFGGNDLSTTPLRWYLERIGHHVEGWELGVHGRDMETTLVRFTDRLERIVDDSGGAVALVGWSLGGVIAREAARNRPELVEQVITFGSPIRSGDIRHRNNRPIRVPVTTIYSRRDAVVDWRDAVDSSTDAVNVEVSSSHIGLGVDPDVWRTIADALDGYSDLPRRRRAP